MNDVDRACAWLFIALAAALLVVAVTSGGCARDGLGGYERPVFWPKN